MDGSGISVVNSSILFFGNAFKGMTKNSTQTENGVHVLQLRVRFGLLVDFLFDLSYLDIHYFMHKQVLIKQYTGKSFSKGRDWTVVQPPKLNYLQD
jgi:hypothetical protein|tara:strand:- start:816 stop:1103 length:288 start_codon:yes stop_codon:yes gene_type:complete